MKKIPPTHAEQTITTNQAQSRRPNLRPNLRPDLRPYRSPQLKPYGDLRDLTLGGSGSFPESGGSFIPGL